APMSSPQSSLTGLTEVGELSPADIIASIAAQAAACRGMVNGPAPAGEPAATGWPGTSPSPRTGTPRPASGPPPVTTCLARHRSAYARPAGRAAAKRSNYVPGPVKRAVAGGLKK